jgi:hypothetical protein
MTIDLYAVCDGDELGALEAIFSGYGCAASVDEFISAELDDARVRIIRFAALRWYAAASGAMRYPWSQEFAIEAITVIRGR